MGVSTDAMVWFGYCSADEQWPESVCNHLKSDDAEEDVYGCGLTKETWDALAEMGVEPVEHCSGDYPMYGLAISESLVTAHRGYPEKLKPLVELPHWRGKLSAAAALIGWKAPPEPAWLLASMWA